jgi:hypothetical protein
MSEINEAEKRQQRIEELVRAKQEQIRQLAEEKRTRFIKSIALQSAVNLFSNLTRAEREKLSNSYLESNPNTGDSIILHLARVFEKWLKEDSL